MLRRLWDVLTGRDIDRERLMLLNRVLDMSEREDSQNSVPPAYPDDAATVTYTDEDGSEHSTTVWGIDERQEIEIQALVKAFEEGVRDVMESTVNIEISISVLDDDEPA